MSAGSAAATATAVTPRKSADDRRRWITLGVVCLGQLMIVLDSTIVNVALPAIQHDLGFTQANLTWVVNAYLIAFGSFLMLGGRLGDLAGRRRAFLGGLALFVAASALCGLAGDATVLVAARFVQGLGGAIASAAILAIVVTEFPHPDGRAKAMSFYTFVSVGGASIGLILGGVVTQALDWHWIFFINLPIGLATLALGAWLLVEHEAIGLDRSVDVLGSILVTAGTMLGVYAIVTSTGHGWGSPHTLGYGGAGVALLAAFLVLEARIANPIMPLRILRLPGLVASRAVCGLLVTGEHAAFFFGALYFEHVLGYSALQTGLAFLPQTLTVAVLSLGTTTRLMRRFGAVRTVIPGLLPMAAGLLLLASAGEHAAFFPTILCAFLLIGLSAGTSFMPLLAIAMASAPARDAGLVSGIANVSMQLAVAVGLALLSVLASHRTATLVAHGDPTRAALTGGYQLAFLAGAGFVAAAILVALLALRHRTSQLAPQGHGSA